MNQQPSNLSSWKTQISLETDLPLGEPGELNRGGRHRLLAWKIDGSLPVFIGEISVDLEVFAYALDHLKVDIVQGRATREEVFFSFLVSYPKLNPFITA